MSALGLFRPAFTLGVRANVQPKSVKAELEKIFSICPRLLIHAELYGLVLAPMLKKGYHQSWEANLQPLGANVSAFINFLTSMF
jgi:hypothetical protein